MNTRPNRLKQRVIRPLMALLILSALLSGCRSEPKTAEMTIEPPQATVVMLTLVEQSRRGARLNALIDVSNPNPVSLPVTVVHYKVHIEDLPAHTFTDYPRIALSAATTNPLRTGQQRLELPVAVPAGRRSLVGRSYRIRGEITYEPPGVIRKLLTESGIPLPSIPFNGTGTITGGR